MSGENEIRILTSKYGDGKTLIVVNNDTTIWCNSYGIFDKSILNMRLNGRLVAHIKIHGRTVSHDDKIIVKADKKWMK